MLGPRALAASQRDALRALFRACRLRLTQCVSACRGRRRPVPGTRALRWCARLRTSRRVCARAYPLTPLSAPAPSALATRLLGPIPRTHGTRSTLFWRVHAARAWPRRECSAPQIVLGGHGYDEQDHELTRRAREGARCSHTQSQTGSGGGGALTGRNAWACDGVSQKCPKSSEPWPCESEGARCHAARSRRRRRNRHRRRQRARRAPPGCR